VEFCRHLRNRWGLPPGKYLWIHFDEKWFWGFVARMQAKACPAIGLDRQQSFARHKSHVNKVMTIAVVGFAFEDTPENGGVAVKISFTRAQASKIAGRMQRAYSGMNAAGGREYRGKVIRRAGDPYSVDTTITGSDEGTSENPKLSLKRVFKEVVFEEVDKMVAMGAPLEGYKPVYQGDKAGPHEEAEFQRFVKQHCADNNFGMGVAGAADALLKRVGPRGVPVYVEEALGTHAEAHRLGREPRCHLELRREGVARSAGVQDCPGLYPRLAHCAARH